MMPSLVEVSDVEDTDIGKRGRYVFEMVGQSMERQFTDTEFDPPNRRAYDVTGDIVGTVTWTIETSDEGAHVNYRQVTDLPGPDLIETVTEPIARTFLQREAETTVENLRTLVEEHNTHGVGGGPASALPAELTLHIQHGPPDSSSAVHLGAAEYRARISRGKTGEPDRMDTDMHARITRNQLEIGARSVTVKVD